MEPIFTPIFLVTVSALLAVPSAKMVAKMITLRSLLNELKLKLEELKLKLERLKDLKGEVEQRKNTAVNAGKVVKEETENWLEDVQCIDTQIQSIEEKFHDVSLMFSRTAVRVIGEEVRQKIQEVEELHRRGTFPGGIVIDSPSTAGAIHTKEDINQEKEMPKKNKEDESVSSHPSRDFSIAELLEELASLKEALKALGDKLADKEDKEKQNKVEVRDMCFLLATCCLIVITCLFLYDASRH